MIFNKHKRLSAALAIVMMAGFITPAFAADPGSVPVELTAQPANFSVTLPTTLPVDVDAEGNVTVADNAEIINNKKGPISISKISVTTKNNWSIVPMNTDFTKLQADSKQLGFQLIDYEFSAGIIDTSYIKPIAGNDAMNLPYTAKLTTQSAAISEQPMDIVFTIGWNKAEKAISDIEIIGPTESLSQGVTYQMNATSKYRGSIIWTSSNPSVATIDENGLVTTLNAGTTTITASEAGFNKPFNLIVDKYVMATDDDFNGDTNGSFTYNGTDNYVEIPHKIKGISITDYSGMFYMSEISGIKSTNKAVTSMTSIISHGSVDLSKLDVSGVTSMANMFDRFEGDITGLNNWNTSNVTNMSRMFSSCKMNNLDLNGIDTSKVTNMTEMFDMSEIQVLNLSNLKNDNVLEMRNMFKGLTAITLNLNNFKTSNVTDMSNMFDHTSVEELNLNSFDTSNVLDMNMMFFESSTSILDLSSFDTSKVTNTDNMFNGSKATLGYAKTQNDANKFNSSSDKPDTLNFVVK